MLRALVAGCFSLEGGGATAGDLLAAEVVCDWLDQVAVPYDIATVPPFRGDVHLHTADPYDYSHAIFVCGPFGRDRGGRAFFNRFRGCRTIGIDLTMLEPLDTWNPFDALIERDSSEAVRPDLTFLSPRGLVPVVGVCLVERYGAPFEALAIAAIRRLVASREMAVVEIDTRLDAPGKKFRSPSEVESILARMDVVVTTRLHGTVLSLKNGVPTISVDPGGDMLKIKRQADAIGWPVVFVADRLTDGDLQKAFDYCLTEEARDKARECAKRARGMLEPTREEFLVALFGTERHGEDMPAVRNSLGGDQVKLPVRISTDLALTVSWDDRPNRLLDPLWPFRRLWESVRSIRRYGAPQWPGGGS